MERAPTNDYALFCLGRALMQLGRTAEARKPLTLAANMNPKRRDYRIYRDRARKTRLERTTVALLLWTHSFSRPVGHFGKRAKSPLFC